MRKVVLLIIGLIMSLVTISCAEPVNVFRYYGVAAYLYDGQIENPQLCILIPSIGYLIIPSNVNITATIDDEYYEDYDLVAGDLFEIIFNDVETVEILESYPARFSVAPTSIHVFNKQDISLERLDEYTWTFAVPIDDIALKYNSTMDEILVDNTYYFFKQDIIDYRPTISLLCTSYVTEKTDSRISFTIGNDYADEWLKYYFWGELSLYPNMSLA